MLNEPPLSAEERGWGRGAVLTDRTTLRRWAKRRRPLDTLEASVVRAWLATEDDIARARLHALRYVISFARLTVVRDASGVDHDVTGFLARHHQWVRLRLEPRIAKLPGQGLRAVAEELPDLLARTRRLRIELLAHVGVDRPSLEREITEKRLVVASGGGGGAGYVYPGVYEQLERSGLVPDLMVGTSIGSLMAMFRARRRRYDLAAYVAAARSLSWGGVFQILETANRYGLPATLRLRLRSAIGHLFLREDGQPMRLSDMEIPLHVIVTGITVDALKHDLEFYEHLLDDDVQRSGMPSGLSDLTGRLKVTGVVREFLSRPDALKRIVLGRDRGTEDFDVIDAAGFSSAVPAVIHYDVLREDARMHQMLGRLYADYGITRLGEGGLTSNVPARAGWESAVEGRLSDGRRNAFVLALDCFAPHWRRPLWFPFQQVVRSANVQWDRRYADLYIPHVHTLSPVNLVPSVKEAMRASKWGRDEARPHMPFVREMCRTLPGLSPEPAAWERVG
ncbi:MAG: patatin-like phospholipase family protein [Myxococcota bacterium]